MTEATGRAILEELRKMNERQAEKEARILPEWPMSVREFAKVVGKCEKTVWRWIDSGKLRVKRVGRVVLITPLETRKFLDGPV